MNKKYFLIVLSGIIALVLGVSYYFAAPMIKQSMNRDYDKTIKSLLSPDAHIVKTQTFELLSPAYLLMGDTQIATRAYDSDGPHYIVIKAMTKGYNGNIGLILSLDSECTIGTVEIVYEQETPGLGDQYKKNEGAWLKNFTGKNKSNTHFDLARNGGDFDAWSGATVTPQGIVRSLRRVLDMCERYQARLFSDEAVVYAEDH